MSNQRRTEAFHLNRISSETLFDFQRQVTFSPVARGENFIKFAMVRDEKGAKSLPRPHPRDEVTMALEGKAEFLVGDRRHRLVSETAIRIPPGTEHAVEVRSDEWGVVSAHCGGSLPCVAGDRNGSTGLKP
jgi:quercetin dioxygenase-like cupin family protein